MTPDRVELSAEARADLDALLSYLLQRNPAAAVRFAQALDDALTMLAAHEPRVDGPLVHLPSGDPCRRRFVHPALLLYERAPGVLYVLSVHHHAREPIAR